MCPAVWCGVAKLDQRGTKEGEGCQDDGRWLTAIKQISKWWASGSSSWGKMLAICPENKVNKPLILVILGAIWLAVDYPCKYTGMSQSIDTSSLSVQEPTDLHFFNVEPSSLWIWGEAPLSSYYLWGSVRENTTQAWNICCFRKQWSC